MISHSVPIAFKHHICWGQDGLTYYAPFFKAIVIVDVLSFCTTVDIAISKECSVIPTQSENESYLLSLAKRQKALLAKKRDESGLSLSPSSLKNIEPKQTMILPSPNGSTLMEIASRFQKPVFAGCFRNSLVLSAFLNSKKFFPLLLVAAGERFPNKMLRPALEDYWGVGSILANLTGDKTIEAECALQSFKSISHELIKHLTLCESGQELMVAGYSQDLELAAQLNASHQVSVLSRKNGCIHLLPQADG